MDIFYLYYLQNLINQLEENGTEEEFNEFMFTYTSRIPVAAIEKISKEKEKEEDNNEYILRYKK